MATPQPGIFAQGTRTHHHLQFIVDPSASDAELIDRLDAVRAPAKAVGAANVVVGFGPHMWRRLAPQAAPPDLAAFTPIDGTYQAPATQCDLWVWLHGTGTDIVWELARDVTTTLAGVADLADERSCFVFHDSRDLTGFVDGTANPPIEQSAAVALVPDGAPGAGGSHAIVMTWRHDLDHFRELAVADQERVFGRTKADSTELDPMPEDSHVGRVEIEEHGEELKIWRRSVPWGSVADAGLVFVAFSADATRFTKMLANMFGTTDDGPTDRLLDFTTPIGGANYFVPSMEDWPRNAA